MCSYRVGANNTALLPRDELPAPRLVREEHSMAPGRQASCLRLVSALCLEQSEEWLSGRRDLAMSDLLPIAGKDEAPAPGLVH